PQCRVPSADPEGDSAVGQFVKCRPAGCEDGWMTRDRLRDAGAEDDLLGAHSRLCHRDECLTPDVLGVSEPDVSVPEFLRGVGQCSHSRRWLGREETDPHRERKTPTATTTIHVSPRIACRRVRHYI